jgi:hypothetical protein
LSWSCASAPWLTWSSSSARCLLLTTLRGIDAESARLLAGPAAMAAAAAARVGGVASSAAVRLWLPGASAAAVAAAATALRAAGDALAAPHATLVARIAAGGTAAASVAVAWRAALPTALLAAIDAPVDALCVHLEASAAECARFVAIGGTPPPPPGGAAAASLAWAAEAAEALALGATVARRVKAVLAQFAFETSTEHANIDAADFADPANKLFPVRTHDELRAAMREVWNASDPAAVVKNIQAIADRKGLDIKTDNYPLYSRPGMSAPLTEPAPPRVYDSYFTQENRMRFFVKDPVTGGLRLATPEELVTFTGGTLPERISAIFTETEPGAQPRLSTPEEIVVFTNGKVKFAVPATTVPAETPEVAALRAQVEALTSQFSALQQQQVVTVAQQAESAGREAYMVLFKAGLVLPNEQADIEAAFAVAHRYDAERTTLAYFGAETPAAKFSLTDFLKGTLNKLAAHKKHTEVTSGFGREHVAVFDLPGEEQATDTKPAETAANANKQVSSALFGKPAG